MSNRAMRKLQNGKQNLPSPSDDGEDQLPPGRNVAQGAGFNAFLLLNADSCSESEVKEDDDQISFRTDPEPAVRKKKKKKKKPTGAKKLATRSSEDNLEMDEVEASVRWVESTLGPAPDAPSSNQNEQQANNSINKFLYVESKYLNPDNEMRRIFGSRVVGGDRAHNQRHRGRNRLILRNILLVTPKPSWPKATGTGLSMRLVDSEREGKWFAWEHDQQYRAVQMNFMTAVGSLNPDLIMSILNHHPMHIDSMLQMSEICKMGEDPVMAAELIERTLYALESTFHPCFNLTSGVCHLDYRRQENRSFFIALFRHLCFVGSKGCYRTSLELCKVLLSLDMEEDPMAAILMVDFYAIRAQEYQWLVNIYNSWDSVRNFHQLPNMAYGVALATLRLAQQTGDSDLFESADKLLQTALIEFPDVLLALLDKCSIEADSRASVHSYFLDTRDTAPALAALCALYVERSFHNWKEQDVLPWLEKNVTEVLDIVDRKDARVAQSKQNRKVRYQGMPRNIHRHIMMCEYKSVLSKLPLELSRTTVMSWDPLPPHDSISQYERPSNPVHQTDDANALRLFFRSFLPNYNLQERGALPAAELADGARAAVDAEGVAPDLRASVHSILDAMRDLLGNIHMAEAPLEAGDEASEEDPDPRDWD